MRRWLAGLVRRLRGVLWALLLAPALALAVAAIVDRGPGDSVRLTFFPAALSVFDPYVWDAFRNSVVGALAVTLAARVVGVALGRAVVRGRFPGRLTLSVLAAAGLVIPPAFVALGALLLMGPPERWYGVERWAGLPTFGRWSIWFWAQLVACVPIVAIATASALARVNPVMEDAAHLEGASQYKVWRQVVWPLVCPAVARALGVVFTLALMDPGAPLLLGLRRSLAYQAAESALSGSPGALNHAAVLVLAATVLASAGTILALWWGGPGEAVKEERSTDHFRPRPTSWPRALASSLFLGLAALTVWLPVGSLLRTAILERQVVGTSGTTTPRLSSLSVRPFVSLAEDELTRGYLINSAILSASVVVLLVLLSRVLTASDRSTRPRWKWPLSLAPLAVGVGILALPFMLRAALRLMPPSASRPSPADVLGSIIDQVDAERVLWLPMTLSVTLVLLPFLSGVMVDRRRAARAVWTGAALNLGASERQATRLQPHRRLGAPVSAILLAIALAATNVTPTLLFTPTSLNRTLGPAVLVLAEEPGDGRARAAALALLGITLNTLALAFHARSRHRDLSRIHAS